MTDKDRETMAEIAGGRAELYNLLGGVFRHLPNKILIENIKSRVFEKLLDCFHRRDHSRLKAGLDHIKSYRSNMENREDEEILNELSVDRTRILRGTGYGDLKPPYEGLYKGNKDIGESVLEVKRFYRGSGLLPEETVRESPDYLCVELDFMKQLCLREKDQWSSGVDATNVLMPEISFLKDHLGQWIGDFCRQAEKKAMTEFYKGFLMILDEFITMDIEYLNDLTGTLK